MVSSQGGRANQKRRTRRALIAAAVELLADGTTPTVAEAGERAGVSRATAYRYFPSRDLLLLEAAMDSTVKLGEEMFADAGSGAEERAVTATTHYYRQACRHETEFRNLLRAALAAGLELNDAGDTPVRQGRRIESLGTALAPAAKAIGRAKTKRLVSALSLLTGVDAMVVLKDICGLSERAGADVIAWATRALVRAALAEG